MRFQSIVLAAVAALGSTVAAQTSAIASATSAVSSAVSSATAVASSVRSSSSASSVASSTSSAASSASVTSSASAQASSSSGSDDEEPASTRVYTSTYYWLTKNPTAHAVSPTLLRSSVVISTSGAINQMSFSTPTGSVTLLDVSESTYTTTVTSTNNVAHAVSKYFTTTQVVTTTLGLPESSSEGAAGKVGAMEIGGVAAFVLGVVAVL